MAKTSVEWVNKLDVNYKKNVAQEVIPVPARKVHSQLISSGNTAKDIIKRELTEKQRDAKGDPKPNFLMVNLGLLLSQPNKRGEDFISLPVRVPGKLLFSVKDSWFVEEGIPGSANRIQIRHDEGKQHSPQKTGFTMVQYNGPNYYVNDGSPTYVNKFHHSEQAVYEYLIRPRVLENLVQRFVQTGIYPGTEVLGVILDMHSTRYVCENCELGMQGMMNPSYVFLQNLKKALDNYDIRYSTENLSVVPRVSANRPDGNKPNKTAAQHSNDANKRLIRSQSVNNHIFEADTRVLNLPPVGTDYHNRTVFISSDVANKPLYKNTIDALIQGEYVAMIEKGQAIKRQSELGVIETENGEPLPASEQEKELAAFAELDVMMNATDIGGVAQKVRRIVDSTREIEIQEERQRVEKLLDIGIPHADIEALSFKQLDILADDIMLQVLEEEKTTFEELAALDETELEIVLCCAALLTDADVGLEDIIEAIELGDIELSSPEKLALLVDEKILNAICDYTTTFQELAALDETQLEAVIAHIELLYDADMSVEEIVEASDDYPELLEILEDPSVIRCMVEAGITYSHLLDQWILNPEKIEMLKNYEIVNLILDNGFEEVMEVYDRCAENHANDVEEAVIEHYENEARREEIDSIFRSSKQTHMLR